MAESKNLQSLWDQLGGSHAVEEMDGKEASAVLALIPLASATKH